MRFAQGTHQISALHPRGRTPRKFAVVCHQALRRTYVKNIRTSGLLFATLFLMISISLVHGSDPNALRFSGKPYYVVAAKGGLNLREKPEKGAKVVRNIPNGTILIITEKTGKTDTIDKITAEWYYTSGSNSFGYVFSGYLKELDAAVKPLYEMNINELEKQATKSSNLAEKAKLFKILHKRFLDEGGGVYCEPETGMERCFQACESWLQNEFCPNFTLQPFSGDLQAFQSYFIDHLRKKDQSALNRHIGSCTVANRICFECDGGGSVAFKLKIEKLLKFVDSIDLDSATISKNSIILKPKAGFKSKLERGPDGKKRNYPFMEIRTTRTNNGLVIEDIVSELLVGESQCVIGL